MTPQELSLAVDTFWNGSISLAARELRLKTTRRLREYLAGESAIPVGIEQEIAEIRKIFPSGKKEVNAMTAISILQEMLVQRGWDKKRAGEYILGVAIVNARAAGFDPALLSEALKNG